MAMASRGILRRCSSSSDATSDLFRTFSSSSACGSFGCEETSQLEPCVVRPRITNGAVSVRESGGFGHGGWRGQEILCTNLSQLHDMRKLLSTNVGRQVQPRAPRGWRIDSTQPAANGVQLGPEPRLFKWQRDQISSVRTRSSSPVGARALRTSTSREERRRQDSVEHIEEEDLDHYMKSRYNEEALKSTDSESETEAETESEEEELSTEPEDLLSKLRRNERGKYDNVAAVLGDWRVLAAASERLNQRRKNWTLASNELEISHLPRDNRSREVDSNWFREAAHQLRSESYPFQPPKRLDVARRGRGEARQLVFVRPREQVVQEAARAILERIYGKRESPGESVHSALKSVKQGWKGVSWFLQFDVRVRDHESVQRRLLKLLAEEIEDPVFLEALRQMFKAGTVWIDTNSEEEKPEGSVLSPLLGDIYFRHLDLEISRIKEEINNEAQA